MSVLNCGRFAAGALVVVGCIVGKTADPKFLKGLFRKIWQEISSYSVADKYFDGL